MMRISKDRDDKAYSPTADQRRVWCNDQEVRSWITADEFRRVVVTSDNKVMNGPVRVERLPCDATPPEPELVLDLPASVGFVGAGLVADKPAVKVAEPVLEELQPVEEVRPEVPDNEVVLTPSERLPEDDSQE